MPNVFPPKLVSVLALTVMLGSPAWAQGTPQGEPAAGARHDCSDTSVEYDDESGLTREERIARMDRALTRSLNRFEDCQQTGSASASGGLSGGGGSGDGGDGDAGEASGGVSSRATSDIAGDEGQDSASASEAPNPQTPEARAAGDIEGDETDEAPVRAASRTADNGKVPEDIPPADNDSVLEAQIRQAAIDETDPELKKRLWNEYRRYKGLPQVD